MTARLRYNRDVRTLLVAVSVLGVSPVAVAETKEGALVQVERKVPDYAERVIAMNADTYASSSNGFMLEMTDPADATRSLNTVRRYAFKGNDYTVSEKTYRTRRGDGLPAAAWK
jgi:hypothetical protein